MEPPVLVSACLIGVECNHRGKASRHPGVVALGLRSRLIPVCPEVAGGLPTPRPAAERSPDGRVRTADGADVSVYYQRGASHAVALALASGARQAVLKSRSPSCGCDQIYDGSHRRILREGQGLTAEALRHAGLDVRSEEQIGDTGGTTSGGPTRL